MRALVQRVLRAAVTVGEEIEGEIEHGLLVLLGVHVDDGEAAADKIADKIANLRIFTDDAGQMNRSVLEEGGSVLLVSQFTLYADTRKGRRPAFTDAARPERAQPLVERVERKLREAGLTVATGVFGAHMQVELVNDGPVTILLEV